MQKSRPLFVLLLLVSVITAFAQKNDDAAKEKQARRAELIEKIIVEIPNLKLPENRAFVSAKAGNLLWDTDAGRGRALFLSAANELVAAYADAEVLQKKTSVQSDLLGNGSTRTTILNMVANRDAEFALELLVKTRPPNLARAIADPKKDGKIDNYGNLQYLLQNENNLEQIILRKAAEQNPERMIKRLKDALAKNITYESLNLLRKLYEKDPESAREIGSQVIDRLIGKPLSGNDFAANQVLECSVNFLNDHIQQRHPTDKVFKFDDSQMRALSDKIIAYYLSGKPVSYLNPNLITVAEKLAPNKVEALKEVQQAGYGRYEFGGRIRLDPEFQKLLAGNANADELLAAAKRLPAELRPQMVQQATSKLIQEGNFDRASAVINENYSGDAFSDAMQNLNSNYAQFLIGQGRFAEAERLIDGQSENNKAYALINLASAIYQKDPVENKAYAAAVIGKVQAMLPEQPENSSDMGRFTQVINAYSNIDSPESFRIFEQLVPKINELTEASAIVSPFQGNTNVQKGEFLMTQSGSFGYMSIDLSVFGQFARKDLDRTVQLMEMFSRRETRINLMIQVAESLN